MKSHPSTQIDALTQAHGLRDYAEVLAADTNEAFFFVHSALLAAFRRKSPTPSACLRAHVDRQAVQMSGGRS